MVTGSVGIRTDHILRLLPIYEYRCENGHLFEVMRKISEGPLTECVECAAPVVKVLHSPAVHFKGSGFYNTDYGTSKRKRELDTSASQGADKNDAKQKDKQDAKKTESKPAAKTD
jgi:putative FmdB family regulatory protein